LSVSSIPESLIIIGATIDAPIAEAVDRKTIDP
jgi:hypothetical protein